MRSLVAVFSKDKLLTAATVILFCVNVPVLSLQITVALPSVSTEGILRTMYDPRLSLTNDVSMQLKEHFGDKLYDTVIPRNVRLAEAPSHGLPALAYDKNSRGALAYLALAGELSRRQRASQRAAART